MNFLVYIKPTKVFRSYPYPAGLGGYISNGFTWIFYIPLCLNFLASNNMLEHLATMITPWIDNIAKRLGHGDCSLSMKDSSTSEVWLRKSNFNKDRESTIQATVRIEVSKSGAKRIMENKIITYSQWFPGWINVVSDALLGRR